MTREKFIPPHLAESDWDYLEQFSQPWELSLQSDLDNNSVDEYIYYHVIEKRWEAVVDYLEQNYMDDIEAVYKEEYFISQEP